MSEDDSALLVSNQLVGNDQPIQEVIHRGQLALVRLEQNQTWQDWCAVIRPWPKGAKSARRAKRRPDRGQALSTRRWGVGCAVTALTGSTSQTGRGCSDALTTSRPSIPGAQDDRSPSSLNSIIPVSSLNAGSAPWRKTRIPRLPAVNQNPKKPSGFTDAEWTDALRTDLGFERFLRVMPNEWRAQMELRVANQIIGREKRLYPNKRLKNRRLRIVHSAEPGAPH